MRYSYQVIRNTDDLKLIKDYLIEEIDTIDSIMPSVTWDYMEPKYCYRNSTEAKAAFRKITDDTIEEKLPLDFFLRYLRRFYIVSGLAESDKEVVSKLRHLYDMAMYFKMNKEE